MRILCLVALLALTACSQAREAPSCTGSPFVLNAGLWQPGPDDLAP
jgi:hypothetical protein